MSFPLPPGGLFPLTTAPTGRNAGGQYPLSAVLSDAIRSLAPTAYWKLDEASGNLADAMSGGYTATVTGSPTYGVAAPSPIGRGVTWSGTPYAVAAAGNPTPSSSLSVVAFINTTNATAAYRPVTAVYLGWDLSFNLSHVPEFTVRQVTNAAHATAASGAASNDGAWRLVAGTFDGTTIRCYSVSASSFGSGSSTSLAGSWNKTAAPGFGIAVDGAGRKFTGTMSHVGVFHDRVLTEASIRWLASVAFGG